MILDELNRWTISLFKAAGLPSEDAAAAAEVFLRATERGVGHHDHAYLPQRLELLTSGAVNPRPQIRCVEDFGGRRVFDGDGGLGEVCVSKITREAVRMAREKGIGMVSVRHSNHFLAASPYAEIALEAGCLAVVWSNTDPCMGGPGAHSEIIGNNPFGFGAPGGGRGDLVLDIAMAYTSLGKLGVRKAAGESVPEFWGRDRAGSYTSDPGAILDGGVCAPMAEHKGFGLALMHEVLTAGLAGGEMGGEVIPRGGWNRHSQTVLAVDLGGAAGAEALGSRVEAMCRAMEKTDPSVSFPGDRSRRTREAMRARGWNPAAPLLDSLKTWSERLGVVVPEV